MEIDDIVDIEWYVEICCDMCGEPIHNHFDCPVCGDDYASSNIYGDFSDCQDDTDVSCETCGSEFRYIEDVEDEWRLLKFKIVKIGKVDE